MFTGIIAEVGRVVSFTQGPEAWQLQLTAAGVPSGVALGDSVAVNGCCLTVAKYSADRIWFDVLAETRRLTNFAQLAAGSAVNLELSLQPSGRMGGHFVTGHVDGLGTVLVLEPRGQDFYLQVRVPAGLGRYLVSKGSIAIDGISLTVAEVAGDTFAVWLIPTTLTATNIREKKPGDAVNLEFDLLAKYVEKLTARPSA
ncbi:MAG: riboflavin synthase [Opitutae bacterium]